MSGNIQLLNGTIVPIDHVAYVCTQLSDLIRTEPWGMCELLQRCQNGNFVGTSRNSANTMLQKNNWVNQSGIINDIVKRILLCTVYTAASPRRIINVNPVNGAALAVTTFQEQSGQNS